ncbi:class I SAM-dependent methyltransferase [Bacillus sp. UMB0728]|uniref:class I SAM-dependent methyltransferase n=1 Tax=Bacillus sp. UMB0728 TaxID=2066052 RepID=UPI000C76CE1E|nr:SAM-dependent methyltransferase [Bacillus sp. UMB0728]PLR72611.1 SAM-dependent methyltransferase [Bacillus sp. UMB0728]
MLELLTEIISRSPSGRITAEQFMDIALYDENKGYYMVPKPKIGCNGDFITTSNISDIYGRAVAKWYFRQTQERGLPSHVCEIGAGDGRFASAFIDEWNKLSGDPVTYFVKEESPYHKGLQSSLIGARVQQVDSLEELKPFCGLIFSNELFDALPVRVVEKQQGRMMEVMVAMESGELKEEAVPLEDPSVLSYIRENGLKLKENQRLEIPLRMIGLISSISEMLQKGIVLTVDYGYTDEELMDPARKRGSLRGYSNHRLIEDFLRSPGKMDITSHVHFDSFIREGEKRDLKFEGKYRQDEFLLSCGILEDLLNHDDPDPFSAASRRNRAIRQLILPSGMSAAFHSIVQTKGLGEG